MAAARALSAPLGAPARASARHSLGSRVTRATRRRPVPCAGERAAGVAVSVTAHKEGSEGKAGAAGAEDDEATAALREVHVLQPSALQRLPNVQLRRLCAAAGLPADGAKGALAARLRAAAIELLGPQPSPEELTKAKAKTSAANEAEESEEEEEEEEEDFVPSKPEKPAAKLMRPRKRGAHAAAAKAATGTGRRVKPPPSPMPEPEPEPEPVAPAPAPPPPAAKATPPPVAKPAAAVPPPVAKPAAAVPPPVAKPAVAAAAPAPAAVDDAAEKLEPALSATAEARARATRLSAASETLQRLAAERAALMAELERVSSSDEEDLEEEEELEDEMDAAEALAAAPAPPAAAPAPPVAPAAPAAAPAVPPPITAMPPPAATPPPVAATPPPADVAPEPTAAPELAAEPQPAADPVPRSSNGAQPRAKGPNGSVSGAAMSEEEEAELFNAHPKELFFFEPPLKAGRRSTFFMNRAETPKLRTAETIMVQFGFNYWQWENGETEARPTSVDDWFKATVEVPKEAYEMNLVLHDTEENYENNNDQDFMAECEGEMTKEAFASFMEQRAEDEAAEEVWKSEEEENDRLMEEGAAEAARAKAREELAANAAAEVQAAEVPRAPVETTQQVISPWRVSSASDTIQRSVPVPPPPSMPAAAPPPVVPPPAAAAAPGTQPRPLPTPAPAPTPSAAAAPPPAAAAPAAPAPAVVPATSEPVAPAPAFPKAAPVPKAEPGDIEKCKAHEGNLIFFDPEPKAGRRTTLFFNRAISDSLRHRDGIVVQFGYNYWRWENGEKAVKSSAVPKSDNADWLKATFEVPAEAYELNMVFKDREEENWENNNDQDFVWQIEDCITPEEFDLVLVRKAEEDEAERQRQLAEEARLKVEAEAEERRKAAEEQAARQAEARAEAKRKQEEQIARQKAKMEAEAARQKQLEEDAAEAAAREEERAIEQFLREEPEAQMRDRQAAEESIGQDRWQAEQASRDLPVTIKKRFFTKPQPQAGKEFTLFYNSNETCMEGAFAIYLVYGFNNWYEYPEGKSKVVQMKMATKTETKSRGKGQWWKAKIKVPAWTYQLDFVTTTEEADGCGAYDNNGMQDYHCRVKHMIKADDWEDRITEKMAEMKKVRKLHEAEQIIKAGRRMARRSMQRAEAMESVRRSQAHTWYAEPATPQAGHSVRIFYNPEHTALNGAQEVYVRGGWNRWKHDQVWGPVIMDPAKESSGGHFVAELEVPMDAWCMDFVFSDSPAEAARYDNKKGLDYHLPVTGSSSKEPPMHIMHVAVEMAPIAKVGGLADVVTSISRAIIELGHTVEVVLPKYDCLDLGAVKNMRDDGGFQFGSTYWRVYRGEVVGVPTFFLGPESGDFSVGCIYGRGDDAARFEFFCHASLEFMLKTQRNPDIVHCHDWSTAPVARKLNEFYSGTPLGNTQSVFTLHNLNYGANLVSEAMKYCAMATTVSPTYAWEVGSNPAIAPGIDKFYGIRNGVDPDIWDPENDMWLAQHYTADTVRQGKSFNKRELQQRTGLKQEPDMPLVGIVTRLTAQKGISLIEHAIHKVLERGGQVVLLGTAPDSRVQEQFEAMRHVVEEGQNCKLILNYDEPLSHLIYAGADMICVPSMFEPCGLTQLIAMRFGSVPIVRKTGGLADTVFDVDHDKERCGWYGYEPNGFSFEGADTDSLDYALNRALDSYYDAREWFQSLQKRCLTQDFTWNRPALEYMELYYQCAKWAALSAYYK